MSDNALFPDPLQPHYTPIKRTQVQVPSPVNVEADQHGICLIRPAERLHRVIAPTLQQALNATTGPVGIRGLMIDLRSIKPLSVVRLSSFLDGMAILHVPLAVIFATDQQSRIARLLHNTLISKDIVAYFTDQRVAYNYLRGRLGIR